jgi:signal transduction histidine kinase
MKSKPAAPATTTERLELLVEGSAGLISEYSLAGVLQRVADLAIELIGARYSAVGILGTDGKTLDSFTTSGLSRAERGRLGSPPSGHGILGLVIREERPIRLKDLRNHPASQGFPPHHPEMKSFLGVPIMGRRFVLGNLYLAEKLDSGEFTEEDEHLATLLAAKAAAAIDNARLHEESARLLEEVQRLHRSRERFFAMVNHELRNALAGVYGWAEMLVRRKDPATVPRAAFEVVDSAERAISLINDLLDLSRLDEDRLQPVIQEVDCLSIIRSAITRVTPAASVRRVALQASVPDPAPTCRTDPSRVEQILINLLTNAIRHTPAGSVVTVSTAVSEGEHGRVIFQVDDEGPGIAEAYLEQIFDVYQTNAGEEGKGTGLGLPLSRRLARLLGGELSAIAADGFGGRFILQLPVHLK